MKTQVCQICNEKKAFKKVISDIDGDFFLVCKKKKCADELYDRLINSGNEEQKEFVTKLKWDANDFQGRSYDKVKRNENIGMWTFLLFVGFLFGFVIYTMIQNVV